jgi:hypothetical protein
MSKEPELFSVERWTRQCRAKTAAVPIYNAQASNYECCVPPLLLDSTVQTGERFTSKFKPEVVGGAPPVTHN